MKRPDQSPTWDEAGPDPLQALFDRAHEDGFNPREVETLWNRLVLVVAMPTPTGGSVGGFLSNAARGVGLKAAGVFAVGGLVALVAATHAWRFFEAPDRPAAAPTAVAPIAGPAAPSTMEREWTAVPVENATTKIGGDSLNVAPRTSATISSGHHEVPRLDPTAHAQPAAPGAAASEPSRATMASSAPSEPPAERTSSASPTVSAQLAEQSPTEGALLLRARRALASDPAATLALTERHARTFPAGDLVPEREVLAIEALSRLKRNSEARARLDAFRVRFPNSLQLAWLEGVVAQ